MKLRLILSMLVVSILATSCQRQYAQLTGFNLQHKNKTERKGLTAEKRTLRKIAKLEQKQSELNTNQNNLEFGGLKIPSKIPLISKPFAFKTNAISKGEKALRTEKLIEEINSESVRANNIEILESPSNITNTDQTQDGRGILYLLLVIIVILLIIRLASGILGPFLWSIIVLVALIALLGLLLGWW